MSAKRYDIEAYLYYDDCRWETTESVDGDFVYASDYDELNAKFAESERHRHILMQQNAELKQRVKALEEVLRFVHDECDWEAGGRRIGSACIKALEAACQK